MQIKITLQFTKLQINYSISPDLISVSNDTFMKNFKKRLDETLQAWTLKNWKIKLVPPFRIYLGQDSQPVRKLDNTIDSYLKFNSEKDDECQTEIDTECQTEINIECQIEFQNCDVDVSTILSKIKEQCITTINQMDIDEQKQLIKLMTYPWNIYPLLEGSPIASHCIPKALSGEPEIFQFAVKHGGDIKLASKELFLNTAFMLEILQIDGLQIRFVPEEYMTMEYAVTAMQQNSTASAYIPERLRPSDLNLAMSSTTTATTRNTFSLR